MEVYESDMEIILMSLEGTNRKKVRRPNVLPCGTPEDEKDSRIIIQH